MRHRGAGRGKQHILDPAGLEALQLRDDLLRRAEQRRVVELEGIAIILDLVITLRTGPAREIADVPEHLAAGLDRLLALGWLADDLQPARHADHHRVIAPADRLALLAEHLDALDDQVGRRDLVEQQFVALARRPLDRFGAARAEPERRVRLLDRARLDDDIVVAVPLALVRKAFTARLPGQADDLHRLVEALGRLGLRHAEAGELISAITLADAEVEPAAGQKVERRRLLGDENRVVPGQHHDRGAETDALGAGRQVAQKVERGRYLAEPGEMVLDEKHAGKPETLGLDNVVDKIVVAVAIAGRPAARPRPTE